MNIRSRLSLKFSFIVAAILLFLSLSVYFSASRHRKSEFYERLKSRGIADARLFIDVSEVDSTLLRIIDQNVRNAQLNEDIVIYNYQNKIIYNNYEEGVPVSYSAALLDKIRLNDEIKFTQNEMETIGFVYNGKYDRLVVIVSAFDIFGLSNLKNLRLILIIGFLSSVIITLIAGWIYAGQALKPVAQIATQADKITISNLTTRINEGNRTDELAHLAITFNKMLNRLEKSFELQKSFVSNSSHELRTPLTAMRGQIEVALLKERGQVEYREILISVLDDLTNLIKLSNNLLEIAKASTDQSLHKPVNTRIDEQLFSAREDLIKMYPHYKVNINFESFPETAERLMVSGSDQLIKSAFLNLMENACKYSSDTKVEVSFNYSEKKITINFSDNGIGIPAFEIEKITEPFYRASNATSHQGHGLGLALTTKIIELHKGQLTIHSQINKGTTVCISFPAFV